MLLFPIIDNMLDNLGRYATIIFDIYIERYVPAAAPA
jgi:hypothetical protein